MFSPNTKKKIKEKSFKNGDNRKEAESSNKHNKDNRGRITPTAPKSTGK